MTHQLHTALAQEQILGSLLHAGARRRAAGVPRRQSRITAAVLRFLDRTVAPDARTLEAEVRLRYGRADDDAALARLAALDNAAVPASPVLVAEVDGELWAARSLLTGHVVADPFRPTAPLVDLLTVRATHLEVTSGDGDADVAAPRRRRLATGAGDSRTAA
jgi:hypothetical protein